MKIEMGESLFYSWLRHVKECQVVQTNWKPSPSWQLQRENEITQLMRVTDEYVQSRYHYNIYKKNTLSQLLQQAEVDALGVSISKENGDKIYAVDVAFHEAGLNYGSREETVGRVAKKLIRTALCLMAYFDSTDGEIIFAAPKINNAVINDLEPCVADLNSFIREMGYAFNMRLIANDDFNEHILKPILIASDGVSDTSELFMRGYQLIKLFGDEQRMTRRSVVRTASNNEISNDALSELKIGKIAQTVLCEVLKKGNVADDEIALMQTSEYSKKTFDIQYPLLKATEICPPKHYYKTPLKIRGVTYYLCCEWFEGEANNDRPYLLAWLETHGAI